MTDRRIGYLRKLQEYKDKKLYMCFVDIEKAFHKSLKKDDRVSDEEERFTKSSNGIRVF